mmetsp:Transcript_19432/g.29515  ORF Transcript_19432/g.29515 Transcript_19432/m.29515 type:complete len:1313 (-) Transcript_19432:240-4178(-)
MATSAVALPAALVSGPECEAANEAIKNCERRLSTPPSPLLVENVARKRKSAKTKIMAAMRLSFGASSSKNRTISKDDEGWPKEESKDATVVEDEKAVIDDTTISTSVLTKLIGTESRIEEIIQVYETEILEPLLVDLVGDGAAAQVNESEKKVRFSFFGSDSNSSSSKKKSAASRIFGFVDDSESDDHKIATSQLDNLFDHVCTEKLVDAAERRLSESAPLVLVESIQERQKRAKTKLSAVFQFTKNAVKARSLLHHDDDETALASHPDELLQDHVIPEDYSKTKEQPPPTVNETTKNKEKEASKTKEQLPPTVNVVAETDNKDQSTAPIVVAREKIVMNTPQKVLSSTHGKMKQWGTELSTVDPAEGTLFAEMGYKLTKVVSEEEDDDILVIRPSGTQWQIGLAGSDSPEWECPVTLGADENDDRCDIRGHGKEMLRHYLNDCRTNKTVPPHALIVVDAIDLMLLKEENNAKRETLDTLEKRCDQVREFAIRDIGFTSIVILDAKHATLYEHAARTSLVVDVTSHGIGTLGVWCGHVLPQTHLAQDWGDSNDKCATVGALIKRALEAAPIDTRGDLANAVYLSGIEVPSLGEDRQVVGAAVLAGFSPSLIPQGRAKVVYPKLYASSAWIGGSLVAALDEASYAFDPNHRTQPDKFEQGCFDASLQYPKTRDTYWAALLADAATIEIENADKVETAVSKRSLDTAAAQAELKLSLQERDNGKEPKPFRPFIKRPVKTGPWWLVKSWGEKPQLAPTPKDYDPTTQDDDSIQRIRERKKKATATESSKSPDTPKHHAAVEANAIAATESEFASFRQETKNRCAQATDTNDLETFQEDIETRATRHLFSCTQIAALVADAPTVRLKLCIVDTLAGRCHDPSRGSCIVDLFTMADTKQKAAACLAARDKDLKRAKAASSNRSSLLGSSRGRGRGGRSLGRSRSMTARAAQGKNNAASPSRRKTIATTSNASSLPSPSARHASSSTNPIHAKKSTPQVDQQEETQDEVPQATPPEATSPEATPPEATPPPIEKETAPNVKEDTPSPPSSTKTENAAAEKKEEPLQEVKRTPQRRHSEQINAFLHQRPTRRMTTTAAMIHSPPKKEEETHPSTTTTKPHHNNASSPPQQHSKQISNFLHQRPTKHAHQAVHHANTHKTESTPIKNRAELTESPRPSTTTEDLARPESMRRHKLASTSEGSEFLAACDQRDRRQLSAEKRRKDDADRRARVHDREEAAILGRNSVLPNRDQVPKATSLEWTPHDATALLAEAAVVQRLLLDDDAVQNATVNGEFDIFRFYDQQKESLPSHYKMYKSFLC